MATSLTAARNALARAKKGLARCEARKSPDWYTAMFQTEVECCTAELRVWQNIEQKA